METASFCGGVRHKRYSEQQEIASKIQFQLQCQIITGFGYAQPETLNLKQKILSIWFVHDFLTIFFTD